jgi:hypothetical protein|tara:strand:+ start:423 stop:962 length:540 start_codon:yes stop_codon:yes gene_type:complete
MIEQLVKHAQNLPAYDLAAWQPVFKGDMDLTIAADGTWYHQGAAIINTKIMQLFGRLLQRQSDGDYWIITPVEAFRIAVEDLPFVIIAADYVDQNGLGLWQFTSNTGDLINLSQADQLLVTYDSEQQPKPKLCVRDGLWGRINRSVFYQLAVACEVVETNQGEHAQLISGPYQYAFGPI